MKKLSILILQLVAVPTLVKCQTFSSLSPGLSPAPYVLYYDQTDSLLYAGGVFNYFGNGTVVNRIAKWNGSTWDSLGSGINDGGTFRDIIRFNDTIFVGGTFSKVGGLNAKGVAKWNGSYWENFANFADAFGYGYVYELMEHDSSLYIGGGFITVNGTPANGLVRYDGSNFYTYPVLSPVFTVITDVCFYNGEMYVGGNFDPGGGLNDIAKFDGTNWVSVGGGLTGGATIVNDMIVYNGELYVSGHFLTIYGDPGDLIAKWDGTSWSSVGSGLSGGNCLDMQVFNSELFVGGSLIAAGGLPVNNIAKWDGTNWYNIGANFNNWVICMEAMDSNNLFLGGGFTMINNDTVKNICKYNILTSVNELQNESNFSIYPNPANDKITVTVYENIEYVFELRDIYNRICIQKENSKELDVSTLTNGIYAVRILVSNKVQYSGKLVIIK